MAKTLLCIGHGYTAQALTRVLAPLGWRIIGTVRSPGPEQEGITQVIWPGEELTPYLDQVSHILISTAPNEMGDPVLFALHDEFLARAQQFHWIGYLSTTGVYGDHQGGWVDEDTPLTPATLRGELRVAAEKAWQKMELPLLIFRLAGIYGPARGPFAKVRNGTARRIVKPGQIFSRIHVDDIVQVLLASIKKPNSGWIYNVCDDLAAPPQDVIGYAAELLGLPVPVAEDFETAEMTLMARSFYSESKRVRNDRIKAELGVQLTYPDYKIGLNALLTAEATL